jgi:hypothetical protein
MSLIAPTAITSSKHTIAVSPGLRRKQYACGTAPCTLLNNIQAAIVHRAPDLNDVP